jgi:hypothetical protein
MSKNVKGRFNPTTLYKKNVQYSPDKITSAIKQKFDVLKSEILEEKNLKQMLVPDNKKQAFILRKLLSKEAEREEETNAVIELVAPGDTPMANLKKTGYLYAWAKNQFKQNEEGANKEFQQGFIKWLQGNMTNEERAYTPWHEPAEMRKIFISFPEVREYLSFMVDVLVESKDLLLKLVELGPQTYNEFFLYYKYIVQESKISDLDYFLEFLDDSTEPPDPTSALNFPKFSPSSKPPDYFPPAPGSQLPPPGSTQPPPGSTQPPPGFTQPPPGYTQPPPGSTQPPPGFTQPPPQSDPLRDPFPFVFTPNPFGGPPTQAQLGFNENFPRPPPGGPAIPLGQFTGISAIPQTVANSSNQPPPQPPGSTALPLSISASQSELPEELPKYTGGPPPPPSGSATPLITLTSIDKAQEILVKKAENNVKQELENNKKKIIKAKKLKNEGKIEKPEYRRTKLELLSEQFNLNENLRKIQEVNLKNLVNSDIRGRFVALQNSFGGKDDDDDNAPALKTKNVKMQELIILADQMRKVFEVDSNQASLNDDYKKKIKAFSEEFEKTKYQPDNKNYENLVNINENLNELMKKGAKDTFYQITKQNIDVEDPNLPGQIMSIAPNLSEDVQDALFNYLNTYKSLQQSQNLRTHQLQELKPVIEKFRSTQNRLSQIKAENKKSKQTKFEALKKTYEEQLKAELAKQKPVSAPPAPDQSKQIEERLKLQYDETAKQLESRYKETLDVELKKQKESLEAGFKNVKPDPKIQQMESQLKEAMAKLQTEQESSKSLKAQLDETNKALAQDRAVLLAKTAENTKNEAIVTNLQKKIETEEKKLNELKKTPSSNNAEIANLKRSLEADKKRLEESIKKNEKISNDEISKLNTKINENVQRIREMTQLNSQKDTAIKELQKNESELRKTFETDYQNLEKQLAEKERQNTTLFNAIGLEKVKSTEAQKKLDEAIMLQQQENITELEKRVETANKKITDFQQQISAKEKELTNLRTKGADGAQIMNLTKQITQLNEDSEKTRKQLQEKEAQIDQITRDRDSMLQQADEAFRLKQDQMLAEYNQRLSEGDFAYQQQIAALQNRNADLQAQGQTLLEQKINEEQFLTAELEKAQRERDAMTGLLGNFSFEQIQDSFARLSYLNQKEKEFDETNQLYQKTLADLEFLKGKNDEYRTSYAEKTQELEKYMIQTNELRNAQVNYVKLVDNLKHDKEQLSRKIELYDRNYTGLQTEMKENEEVYKYKLEEQEKNLKTKYEEEKNIELGKVNAEFRSLDTAYRTQKMEIEKYTRELDSARDALIRQKKESQILSNQFAVISKGYEQALNKATSESNEPMVRRIAQLEQDNKRYQSERDAILQNFEKQSSMLKQQYEEFKNRAEEKYPVNEQVLTLMSNLKEENERLHNDLRQMEFDAMRQIVETDKAQKQILESEIERTKRNQQQAEKIAERTQRRKANEKKKLAFSEKVTTELKSEAKETIRSEEKRRLAEVTEFKVEPAKELQFVFANQRSESDQPSFNAARKPKRLEDIESEKKVEDRDTPKFERKKRIATLQDLKYKEKEINQEDIDYLPWTPTAPGQVNTVANLAVDDKMSAAYRRDLNKVVYAELNKVSLLSNLLNLYNEENPDNPKDFDPEDPYGFLEGDSKNKVSGLVSKYTWMTNSYRMHFLMRSNNQLDITKDGRQEILMALKKHNLLNPGIKLTYGPRVTQEEIDALPPVPEESLSLFFSKEGKVIPREEFDRNAIEEAERTWGQLSPKLGNAEPRNDQLINTSMGAFRSYEPGELPYQVELRIREMERFKSRFENQLTQTEKQTLDFKIKIHRDKHVLLTQSKLKLIDEQSKANEFLKNALIAAPKDLETLPVNAVPKDIARVLQENEFSFAIGGNALDLPALSLVSPIDPDSLDKYEFGDIIKKTKTLKETVNNFNFDPRAANEGTLERWAEALDGAYGENDASMKATVLRDAQELGGPQQYFEFVFNHRETIFDEIDALTEDIIGMSDFARAYLEEREQKKKPEKKYDFKRKNIFDDMDEPPPEGGSAGAESVQYESPADRLARMMGLQGPPEEGLRPDLEQPTLYSKISAQLSNYYKYVFKSSPDSKKERKGPPISSATSALIDKAAVGLNNEEKKKVDLLKKEILKTELLVKNKGNANQQAQFATDVYALFDHDRLKNNLYKLAQSGKDFYKSASKSLSEVGNKPLPPFSDLNVDPDVRNYASQSSPLGIVLDTHQNADFLNISTNYFKNFNNDASDEWESLV